MGQRFSTQLDFLNHALPSLVELVELKISHLLARVAEDKICVARSEALHAYHFYLDKDRFGPKLALLGRVLQIFRLDVFLSRHERSENNRFFFLVVLEEIFDVFERVQSLRLVKAAVLLVHVH